MSNTIFYKGKLKKNCTPNDVFVKILAGIKKKGVTSSWKCKIDEEHNRLIIDFNDETSENMVFQFIDNSINGFCKVGFPLDETIYQSQDSEFITILNILYSIRGMFSKFEVDDDFGIWNDFIQSKQASKIQFRELTEEEEKRVKALFDLGYTTPKSLILSLIANDLGAKEGENLYNYVPPSLQDLQSLGEYLPIIETWLYETMCYKDRGRIRNMSPDEYADVSFTTGSCSIGISEAFFEPIYESFGYLSKQIHKLFIGTFKPLYDMESDAYKKCSLAYQFIVSILDVSGLKKENNVD